MKPTHSADGRVLVYADNLAPAIHASSGCTHREMGKPHPWQDCRARPIWLALARRILTRVEPIHG